MRARQTLTRTAPCALFASLVVAVTPATAAGAQSPAPAQGPVPTAAEAPAPLYTEAGLNTQIAGADAAVQQAQAKLAATEKKVNAAQQRYDTAAERFAAAQAKADQARKAADAAARHEQAMKKKVDELSGTGVVGSLIGFLSSDGFLANIAKASLLNAAGSEELDLLDNARHEVDTATKAANAAKEQVRKASATLDAATKAKAAADRVHQAAVQEKNSVQERADWLLSHKVSNGVYMPAIGQFTSGFGARWGAEHQGIDIANDIGTPIYSVKSGTVINSGPASGFGLWVRVQHDDGLVSVYGHIHESLVSVGQRVDAGQQIATMGNRGQSTGPHLHFEIGPGGGKIDPLPWLRSQGLVL